MKETTYQRLMREAKEEFDKEMSKTNQIDVEMVLDNLLPKRDNK